MSQEKKTLITQTNRHTFEINIDRSRKELFDDIHSEEEKKRKRWEMSKTYVEYKYSKFDSINCSIKMKN